METPHHPAIRDTSLAKIALAKGPIYREDEREWASLETNPGHIADHFASMGIELVHMPDDDMAFLRQMDVEELGLPVLIRRTRMTYELTALGLVLRDALIERESRMETEGLPAITRDTIRERLEPMIPPTNDERKREAFVDRAIKAAIEFSFLAKTDQDSVWEIKRIVKAKFSIDLLDGLRDRLKSFVAEGNTTESAEETASNGD